MLAALLFVFFILSTAMSPADGAPLPGDAQRLLPVLGAEIDRSWPDLRPREFPAGLIEQESLWRVNAHLRTTREHGCGLGQFTVAYAADGRVRFDALAETRALDRSLVGWDWRDCTAVQHQLRAVVLKLKSTNRDCLAVMVDSVNALKCDAAKYNGGAGSFAARIRLCRSVLGCNPKLWDGHLDRQCPQSRVKAAGYAESFCEINSKYPGRVFNRMRKYEGKV